VRTAKAGVTPADGRDADHREGRGCIARIAFHLCGMSTNFSLFRDRFAEACRVRGMTQEAVCRRIGMGGRSTLEFHSIGLRALDLYRVCQIADRLDVSVDWLLGRSDVMEVPKGKGSALLSFSRR
jgi:hypothetical protein